MKRSELIPLHNLVELKRGKAAEFLVVLFEQCNLSCGFCFQDHSSTHGMDTVVEKAKIIIDNHDQGTFTVINVMGGELFSDDVPDALFEHYYLFSKQIADNLKNYKIRFTSNLVNTKPGRIRDLFDRFKLNDINVMLATSYDPVGRFNKSTLERYKSNLLELSDIISTISMVATKPTINRLMGNKDDYFKKLYMNYTVYFDTYSPSIEAATYRPSEKELVDFWIFLAENYPEAYPVKDYIKDQVNDTSCRGSMVVLPDGLSGSCKITVNSELFDHNKDNETINDMESKFIIDRGCMECEFYNRCGLGCFLSSSFISNDVMDECEMKRFFRHSGV